MVQVVLAPVAMTEVEFAVVVVVVVVAVVSLLVFVVDSPSHSPPVVVALPFQHGNVCTS